MLSGTMVVLTEYSPKDCSDAHTMLPRLGDAPRGSQSLWWCSQCLLGLCFLAMWVCKSKGCSPEDPRNDRGSGDHRLKLPRRGPVATGSVALAVWASPEPQYSPLAQYWVLGSGLIPPRTEMTQLEAS